MTRNDLRCPECGGRQVVLRETLVDCPRCLGSGWVSLPGELLDRRRIVEALVAFLVVLAVVIVAIGATTT